MRKTEAEEEEDQEETELERLGRGWSEERASNGRERETSREGKREIWTPRRRRSIL